MKLWDSYMDEVALDELTYCIYIMQQQASWQENIVHDDKSHYGCLYFNFGCFAVFNIM